jgi:hypothetical protein
MFKILKKEDKGNRHNEGKLQWNLVDFESLEPMVQALMYGVDKYGKDNWKKGLVKEEIIDSLLRHVFKILKGELIDKESNLPHTGHILANAMFLSYFNKK